MPNPPPMVADLSFFPYHGGDVWTAGGVDLDCTEDGQLTKNLVDQKCRFISTFAMRVVKVAMAGAHSVA